MQDNVSLKPYNSLQVEARAKRFVEITSSTQLKDLGDLPTLFLGQGCNTLFTKDWPGLVIKNNLLGREVMSDTDQEVVVTLGSGQDWHDFVTWCVDHNWSGVENMALIPGTVGAAAVGNIAAYGQNQEDIFVSLDAIDITTGKSTTFTKAECAFRYRDSFFKSHPNFFITAVTYKLSKVVNLELSYHATRHMSLLPTLQEIAQEPYTIKDIYHAIIKMRTDKLPDMAKVGTAGSFFKNPTITKEKFAELQTKIPDLLAYPVDKLTYTTPAQQDSWVKVSIARALDELGWKGKQVGRVATSPNQALYVINLGGATGQEIFEYAEAMRADILKNFAIDLEYEVRII